MTVYIRSLACLCLVLGVVLNIGVGSAVAQTTTFTLTPTPNPVPENAGTVNVVITLSQGAPWDRFALYFSTRRHSAGSNQATPGTDFQHYSMRGGTEVQFLTKGDTKATVAVAITNDSDSEGDETFEFVVHDDADEGVLAPGSFPLATVITIQDDDLPLLSIAADDADGMINEGESAAFSVSVSAAQSEAITVPLSVAESGNVLAANQPTSVVIAAGETSAALNIPLDNDSRDEEDSTITVTIRAPSDAFLLGAASTATLTVSDDDDEPVISYAAAEAVEGMPLRFRLSLSAASEKPVQVNYETESADGSGSDANAGGTATAGDDYEARMLTTLSFQPGETEKIIEVATMRDSVEDPDETVILLLSLPPNANASLPGYTPGMEGQPGMPVRVTGTISEGLNDEEVKALNEAILPHVAATVADETSLAIGDRVNAAFDHSGSLSPSAFATGNFSFAFAPAAGSASGDDWAIWGRGYYRDLAAEKGPISFEGDVTGFMLGIDDQMGDYLFGIALNQAHAEVEWDNSSFTGTHETTVAGIHPYFGWQSGRGHRFWASLGYEQGDLELLDDGNSNFQFKKDVALRTASIGGYGPLYQSGGADGALRVGFVADTVYAQLEETDDKSVKIESGWLRGGVDLDYDRSLRDGTVFGLSAGLALRHDYGDAKQGAGMELSGGLNYYAPASGIRLSVDGRRLMTNESDTDDWGISGSIAWQPSASGDGLSLAFSPEGYYRLKWRMSLSSWTK